jgi:hypothetical protein
LKQGIRVAKLIFLALAQTGGLYAHAQAVPTASQRLQLSTFAGGTGNFTGLNSGKNLGVTAGVDLGFRSFFSLNPFLEARGTYPIDRGHIDSQKNALGGLKVVKTYGRFNPYVDILLGRGEIYYNNGYPGAKNPSFSYLKSPAHVLSPGGGLDIELTDHFAIKIDAQFQRYSTPVTNSGYIYSKPITLGLVYRLHFDRYGH